MSGATTAAYITAAVSAVSAVSSIAQGMEQKKIANYQAQQTQLVANQTAKQLEQRAGQERAAAQQKMIEAGRTKNLAISRAQAIAAAGGGSLDPSVINIMGDLETQGKYNQDVALYEGEDAAVGDEYQAKTTRATGNANAAISRMQGSAAQRAGFTSAATTLMKGGVGLYNSLEPKSLMDKYGGSFGTGYKTSNGLTYMTD